MKSAQLFPNAGISRVALRKAILRTAAIGAVALMAAGCGTLGQGSTKEGTTSSGSVPFSNRISSLFGGSKPDGQSAASTEPLKDEDIDCPRMDIRQGASTLLVNNGSGEDATGLRYQGTFVRAARECRLVNGQLSIRVGIEGRLIVGPSGAQGPVTVPVRVALVRETLNNSEPVWSKLYPVGVTIPPGAPNVSFSQISEDLVVPMPSPDALEQMVVYIGFDPAGLDAQSRRRPPPKAAAKKRRAG